MDVSIIIPTRRRPRALRSALDSCLTLDTSGLAVEVLVVANGEDPELADLLAPYFERLPLRFFVTTEIGVNRARNRGLREARGRFLYFLDDDCAFRDPRHLQRALAEFARLPELAGVGGPYLSLSTAPLAARYYNFMSNLWLRFYTDSGGNAQRLLGGNSCYRRGSLAGNEFAEQIAYGGAESELQARLVGLGARFRVLTDVAVAHSPEASWWGVFRKAWRQSAERARAPGPVFDRAYFARFRGLRNFSLAEVTGALALFPYFCVGQTAFFSTRIARRLGRAA